MFLLGSAVAPARELAEAIAEQRRRNRTRERDGLTLHIPVDRRGPGTAERNAPLDSPAGVQGRLLAVAQKASGVRAAERSDPGPPAAGQGPRLIRGPNGAD